MDRASVLGIVSGFILLVWACCGGNLRSFWDFLGADYHQNPRHHQLSFDTLEVMYQRTLCINEEDHRNHNTIVSCRQGKTQGLLTFEDATPHDSCKKIRLVVDYYADWGDLETELAFIAQRHKTGQSMFETMGTFSPAFGMLGTLIGLIHMLTNLDTPDAVGPGMATALVTTFYGSVLANMVFLPIANKLKHRSAEEIFRKEAIIEGVLSIQAGDNPRIVQEKLKSFVAPKQREEMRMPSRMKEVAGSDIPADVRR